MTAFVNLVCLIILCFFAWDWIKAKINKKKFEKAVQEVNNSTATTVNQDNNNSDNLGL